MNSYATTRPLADVREVPSIIPAAGAIHISSIVAPVDMSCRQHPAIRDNVCIGVDAVSLTATCPFTACVQRAQAMMASGTARMAFQYFSTE